MLPQVDQFIAMVFRDVGMAMPGGMQLTPVTFTELDAYCHRAKVDLTAWESQNVINMSRDYCSWLHKGAEPECTSPWNDTSPEAIAENDRRIAEQMKSLKNRDKPQ